MNLRAFSWFRSGHNVDTVQPVLPIVPNESAMVPQSAPVPITDKQDLSKDVRMALRHLHDPAYLGTVKSLSSTVPGKTIWERGLNLQQRLICAMQALDAANVSDKPQAVRHYQILWLLYYEGKSRQHIMQELALSERHYERKLREAVAALTAHWQVANTK
jgi:hypothetical protein